jgi:hypothetical protein
MLPKSFTNLKMELKQHICETQLHRTAAAWEKKNKEEIRKELETVTGAWYNLGSLAYSLSNVEVLTQTF